MHPRLVRHSTSEAFYAAARRLFLFGKRSGMAQVDWQGRVQDDVRSLCGTRPAEHGPCDEAEVSTPHQRKVRRVSSSPSHVFCNEKKKLGATNSLGNSTDLAPLGTGLWYTLTLESATAARTAVANVGMA